MASTTVKTTYSLDVETLKALEQMAKRWKVSKSEALRRAIRAARHGLSEAGDAVDALDELQRSLRLTHELARRWERTARSERHAFSRRLESRSR